MSNSVCTDMSYVEGGRSCCCRDRMVFRSVWDRLCQQLFGSIPVGMDTEDQLPDIEVFDTGVALRGEDEGEFSFSVTTSGDVAPKPYDVISYQGKFYIIGEVD